MRPEAKPTWYEASSRAGRRFSPRVVLLEDRCTPATFYVDPAFTGVAPGTAATYNNYPGQTPVAGVVVGANGFATITAALDAAAANQEADTLDLAATTHVLDNTTPAPSNPNATAPVTATITGDNVSLVGSGNGVTIILPKGYTKDGLSAVLQAAGVAGSTTVLNLSKLTIDGKSNATPALNIGRAVSYTSGATGTIDNVTIQNVAFPATSDGYAISALTGSNITVRNSTLAGYGRAGVTVSNSTAVIQGNTITGLANANKFNYGIQVANNGASPGGPANVIINANTITNNIGGQADSAGNFQVSAGILAFTTTNTTPSVQVFANNISANQAGGLVASTASAGVDGSTVLFYANNFTNNLSPAIAAPTTTAGAVQAPANFYAGNAPVQNGSNGVTDNVATGGTFLTTPAPVIIADSPSAYQQKVLDQGTIITIFEPGPRYFAVGAGGGQPRVDTYVRNGAKVATVATGFDPSFTGGLRVSQGDVDDDGLTDTIVGTGPGVRAEVKIISGRDNATVLADLFPFGDFTGGVFVACADVTFDGDAEVLVTPDQSGGPRVVVYDGASLRTNAAPKVIANFLGIADVNGKVDSTFRGGARPALADVTGDRIPDLILSAGFTGGPRVSVWDGSGFFDAKGGAPTKNPLANFFAFESTLRNGAFVGGIDINGDGKADLILGGGPGGGPRVRVADAAQVLKLGTFSLDDPANAGVTIASFFAGAPSLRGGVRVAGRDLDGDGVGDIVTGSGTGTTSDVRVYSGAGIKAAPNAPSAAAAFDPFAAVLADGVYVGTAVDDTLGPALL